MSVLIRAVIRVTLLILGIGLVYKLVEYIGVLLVYRDGIDEYMFNYYLLLTFGLLIPVIILILLWWKTDWVVNRVAGNLDEKESLINISNIDLLGVGIRIIGVYLLVVAIPDIIGLIAHQVSMSESERLLGQSIPVTTLTKAIFNLVVGIFLIVRENKGITRFISNLWNKGELIEPDIEE